MASRHSSDQVSGGGPASTPLRTSHCKLVLLGEAAVGKSSLVLRFVSNDFQENKEPTIGAAFLTQKCRLDTRMIKFEIWDTAGQERFHSLAPMYYRNAQAAVVVYDITKAASLEKAKSWVKELQRQASQGIIIALAGNKYDLVEDTQHGNNPGEDGEDVDGRGESRARQVTEEEARQYAAEAKLLFFETSAKTGHNVHHIFTEIAKAIPEESLATTARGARFGQGGAASGRQQADDRVDLNRNRNKKAQNDGCAC